ncbi:MAG: fumarylacetoacetate hydrolase family protein [Kangiellaceae bacterium]|jgi:2-keto-4-pentenoate hydratase/2-oxohepta-3-ene-1,7-dioic acid hydratase in catechol pathway|nr:fumarylacetoacetate hydrolase family protein [Kangiellaceae bacterium]
MASTNDYRHISAEQSELDLPAGKVICVGRNYADHAKELGNDVPSEPVLFIKPATALVNWQSAVSIPTTLGECHHELELALLIGTRLCNAQVEEAAQSIKAVTLALDLTMRDVQAKLKSTGKPWELAKAIDCSCPVADWHSLPSLEWLDKAQFKLTINGELRQAGNSQHMLWPALDLIAYISRYFTLLPGDIVLTGTPAGVGPLQSGDRLVAELNSIFSFESEVKCNERF